MMQDAIDGGAIWGSASPRPRSDSRSPSERNPQKRSMDSCIAVDPELPSYATFGMCPRRPICPAS